MASCHATASPKGDAIAYTQDKDAFVNSLTFPALIRQHIGIDDRHVKATRWSPSGLRILIRTTSSVKSYASADLAEVANLDNGSGSLGNVGNAEFLNDDSILIVWEFGKAKIWDLESGRTTDLQDLKTTGRGLPWRSRPTGSGAISGILAYLSKSGAADQLCMCTMTGHHISTISLNTIDVQLLTWSPDGRWLIIVDVPTSTIPVSIFTPEGHLFRSYPPAPSDEDMTLTVQNVVWSPDSALLAVSYFDGKIELLSTKTFTAITIVQHDVTIDQRPLPASQQAQVWQEAVTASAERIYSTLAHPVSAPLTRTKTSTDISEIGIAEICFSCDGSYMATRESRMLNTVWIWSITTLSAHAVIIQHSPVRRLSWHPLHSDMLMIDCAEGIAYVYHVSASTAPEPIPTTLHPRAALSWLSCLEPTILAVDKSTYKLLSIDGSLHHTGPPVPRPKQTSTSNEDHGLGDSLFDVLSGRKPLPPKTEPSFTERIDLDVNDFGETINGIDDTFGGKGKPLTLGDELDPLDDSEIF